MARQNAHEAAVLSEIEVIPVDSLAEAVGFFAGSIEISPHLALLNRLSEELSHYPHDFADVRD